MALKSKAAVPTKKVPTTRPEMKREFKGRKVSGGIKNFRKWSEWEEGDVMVGKYLNSEKDTRYGGMNRVFEVIEANFLDKNGKSLEGQQLSLNKNATIDRVFKEHTPKPGTDMQITYNGKEEMTGGDYAGQEKHVIEVILGGEDYQEEVENEEEEDEGYF